MVILGLGRLVVILGVFSLTSQSGDIFCKDAILAVYPDVSDCQSFYACSNYIPRKLRCNPGLLFDSESNQCVHESEAICARRCSTDDLNKFIDESAENTGETYPELGRNTNVCEVEGALMGLVTDDCHSYYVCKNGLKTKETCGFTQVFNLLSQACSLPQEVIYEPLCDDGSFPGPGLVQDRPAPLNYDYDIFVDAAENQPWIPGNCVYNFDNCSFEDQVWLHPNDNMKFYTCKDGLLCEQQCLNGMQFDPDVGRCGRGPFPGADSSTTPCPAACSSNITVLDDGCSDDWRCDGLPVGTLLPDPDQLDCTVYFDCVNPINGIPQSCKFQCAGGTTFNPYEQCCDYNNCVDFDCTTDTFKPPTMTTPLSTSTTEVATTTTTVPSTSTSTPVETTSSTQTPTTTETASTTEISSTEFTTTTTETTSITTETSSTMQTTTDSTTSEPTSTSTISSTAVTSTSTPETSTHTSAETLSTITSSTSEPTSTNTVTTSTSSPSSTPATTVVTTSSTMYQTELPDTAPTASEPTSQTPPLGPCTTYPCITITIPTTTTPIPLWPLRRSREYISQFLIAFYSVFFFALLFLAIFLRRRWVRRKIKDHWPFPNI